LRLIKSTPRISKYKILKKITIKFFLLTLLLTFLSCKEKDSNDLIDLVINKNSIIEFRDNNEHNKGKVEFIANSSEKFEKLKDYFNNLKGFIKTEEEINIYPNYILINENLKILISVDLIYIEYYNSNGENIKFFKNISPEEFLSFNFLTNDNKWIYELGKVYGFGTFKKDKYSFCGSIPREKDYQYKIGKWKFWNQKRDLIAEGEFTIDSSLVKGQGGCDYYIKTSKIRKENWIFYNSEQKIIEPHFEDIFILENANQ
jgi:hypothetical protein